MQKSILFLSLICIILSACTSSSRLAPTSTKSAPAVTSETLTPVAQATMTRRPTVTAWPTENLHSKATFPPAPTATLPAIPTLTPTFDVRTNLTATPAPKAECPQVTSAKNADIGFLDFTYGNDDNRWNAETNILNFLNQYGASALYKAAKSFQGLSDIVLKDLTNDGEPELAIRAADFYIFGCREGKYVTLLKLDRDGYLHAPVIETIRDANQNGVPELTILLRRMSQGGHFYGVYEWNGERMASLIASDDPDYPDSGSIWVEATGKIHYEDVDHDLLQELILDSGIPVWSNYRFGLPWRNERSVYKWNGKNYLVAQREFDPPEFRFQAVQDGDLALSQQEYAKAMDLYQQTIFKDQLKAYSLEIRQNLQETWDGQFSKVTPTPVPSDPTEYPRLAAYAYYRMIILHTFLGEMDAAQINYASLQEKFLPNNPGHPYAEMASAFWSAYHSAGTLSAGCAAAIQYAAEHSEILVPLGSDYHGWQSHQYVPTDMCPFR